MAKRAKGAGKALAFPVAKKPGAAKLASVAKVGTARKAASKMSTRLK
jgi:hypothetical protein